MSLLRALPYIAVSALVTYLVRAVPLILMRRKIKGEFLLSFIYYLPYTIIATMTFPAVFSVTGNVYSSLAGLLAAFIVAWLNKGLLWVSLAGAAAAFLVQGIIQML